MITLFNNDCLKVLPTLKSKSVDLICADIPYNIGVAYKSKLEWDVNTDYMNFVTTSIRESERILKDSGSFYLFHNNISTLSKIINWIEENTRFKLMQMIVWNKYFKGCRKEDYLKGYIVENRNNNYYKMVEYILFFVFDNTWKLKQRRTELGLSQSVISKEILSKNGKPTGWYSNIESGKYLPTKETIKPITKHLGLTLKDLRHTFNNQKKHHSVWNYSIEPKLYHPTQKPVKLMENIILHSSNLGDTVLDFVMGVGTTGVASINLDRNFIGIEINKKYFEYAKERILG